MFPLPLQAGAAPAADWKSMLFGSPIFVLFMMFAIMYFLILRPKQKEQKKHETMLKGLQRGDRVLTTGGIYGVVETVKEKEGVLTVRIAEKTRVEVAKSAVTSLLERGQSTAD